MNKYLDKLKGLSKDTQEKAKECHSKEDFVDFLSTNGVDVSGANGPVMLDDKDLNRVAGGTMY